MATQGVKRSLDKHETERAIRGEVWKGYASAFYEMFCYMAELDSTFPDFSTRKCFLPRDLPRSHELEVFLECLISVLRISETGIINQAQFHEHFWTQDFQHSLANAEVSWDDFWSTDSHLRSDPKGTIDTLSEFLIIVVGHELLSRWRTHMQNDLLLNNVSSIDDLAIYIAKHGTFCTEAFLRAWIEGIPKDSDAARVSKHVQFFLEHKNVSKWKTQIMKSDILVNPRMQMLQELGSRLLVQNVTLRKHNDELVKKWTEAMEHLSKLKNENKNLHVDLSAQHDERMKLSRTTLDLSGQLAAQHEKLKNLELPTQCMAYRHYAERLGKSFKKQGLEKAREPYMTPEVDAEADGKEDPVRDLPNQPFENQGLEKAWQAYWTLEVEKAVKGKEGPVRDLLRSLPDPDNEPTISHFKSTGNQLYSRLSKPIHQFIDNDCVISGNYWYSLERDLLPLIKHLAYEIPQKSDQKPDWLERNWRR